jgi:hypothetical protein
MHISIYLYCSWYVNENASLLVVKIKLATITFRCCFNACIPDVWKSLVFARQLPAHSVHKFSIYHLYLYQLPRPALRDIEPWRHSRFQLRDRKVVVMISNISSRVVINLSAELQTQYTNYKSMLQQLAQKIGDIEQEAEEHRYVISYYPSLFCSKAIVSVVIVRSYTPLAHRAKLGHMLKNSQARP